MTLEKLEEIREKIAALSIDTASEDEEDAYGKVLRILDSTIAKERAERAKPECYPDGDKCIGCTTPPSGMTCALHGTVASVAGRAKPGPGDMVLFVTHGVEPEPTTWKRGMSATDPLGKTRIVVLMRAAEVKRRINEI